MAKALVAACAATLGPAQALLEVPGGAATAVPSLAVCVTGPTHGMLGRGMVHGSLRHNLLAGLNAARTDVFAEVEVATVAEEQEVQRVLTVALQARSVRVHVGGAPQRWPRCAFAARSATFLESVGDPERFVRSWEGIEACFQQVQSAEEVDGQPYDWVLRVRPDLMWHAPADALSSFSPQVVSVSRQADEAFLSPRPHAEAAFRGVLGAYRECSGGRLVTSAHNAASFFRDELEAQGVQHVHRTFRGVLVWPRADDGHARRRCREAAWEGLEEDLCMRLLYGERPEPALVLGEPIQGDAECAEAAPGGALSQNRRVLVATPLKNAVQHLGPYAQALQGLAYPKHLISVAFLVSDSLDGTAAAARQLVQGRLQGFASVEVLKEDFNYEAPEDRHAFAVQASRRAVLAASRNELLRRALKPETFAVLWLDVDVVGYPETLVQDLLAVRRPVVAAHVVVDSGTYDRNSWREAWPERGRMEVRTQQVAFEGYGGYEELRASGGARDHMDVLRALARAMGARDARYAVRLDGVGTAVLLVEARVHREAGILFPEAPYRQRLESEGFGLQARDRGFQVCGLPLYEVRHRNEWTGARGLRASNDTGNAQAPTARPEQEPAPAPGPMPALVWAPSPSGEPLGPEPVVTVMEAEVAMADVRLFDRQAWVQAVADMEGVDLADVQIISQVFQVLVEYTLTSAISVAQATKAIARVNGVGEARVSVRLLGRRLGKRARRLAAGFEVTITTDSATSAEALEVTAGNAQALTAFLAEVGVAAEVQIRRPPAAKVSLRTAIRAPEALVAPGPGKAAAMASAVGGAVVFTAISTVPAAGRGAMTSTGLEADAAGAVPATGPGLAVLLALVYLLAAFYTPA